MDETQQKPNDTAGTTAGARGEATGAPAGTPAQSATEDLKKVADRAKAATSGFSFDNLFNGRLDEMNYLYFAVGSFVVGLLLMMMPVIGMIASLALLVIGLGATARRFHDINMAGWTAVVIIIPFLGLLAVIYLCWKTGDAGANPFGPPPDKKRDMFKAILNT